MSTSAGAIAGCRNCGAAADGKYCPECGQETALHPPSALEFLHEFIGHYVALEGALWRTLKTLARPGRLTLEYFAGRRRTYVLPLRLYLTASIVFFLVARVFPPPAEVHVVRPGNATFGGPVTFDCKPGQTVCTKIRQRMIDRFGAMTGPKVADYLMGRLAALFPYAMFVLVPVFALLTSAAYWNRPYNYGEHLVFALHYHAAAFLMGALVAPLRDMTFWVLPSIAYLMFAMWRVFGGRWWLAIARGTCISFAYLALIFASMLVIVTATVLL